MKRYKKLAQESKQARWEDWNVSPWLDWNSHMKKLSENSSSLSHFSKSSEDSKENFNQNPTRP
jgi:hypothetical protein